MAIPQNGGSRAQQVINIGSADYSLFRWIAPDEVPICTKSCPFGSKTVLAAPKRHFWSNPDNGHHQTGSACRKGANFGSERSLFRHD
jgi:hypothetical protein